MNFLTSGYSTKTLLGAGTNSMAMNKTINAEVFGVYELGALIEGFSLEIDALLEPMIRTTKQTHDLDAFFAGFFVHLIGAGFVPYGDAGRKGEGFFFSFIADGGVGG